MKPTRQPRWSGAVFIVVVFFCRQGTYLQVEAAERPNVVLLLSDDQRWSDYSFLGHPESRTPHHERLASDSLVVTGGYVPTSLCRPSLAAILTGRYPHQNGITGNDPRGEKRTNEGRQVMVDRFRKNPRLPQTLHDAGYLCFQSGEMGAECGVTANAICPGYVWTPLVERQIDDQAKSHGVTRDAVIRDVLLAQQPNKRFATVEEIGALTAFLCGPGGASITGTALPVDGGWTAH